MEVGPKVWTLDWGVHIQPAGTGASTIKYLGRYVARIAMSDSRIVEVDTNGVTLLWKDRSDHNRTKRLRLTGNEFVERYLRHVLPCGLRAVRYYGFCHPTAKANRMRVQFNTGMKMELGAELEAEEPLILAGRFWLACHESNVTSGVSSRNRRADC